MKRTRNYKNSNSYQLEPYEERAVMAYLHGTLGLSALAETLGYNKRSSQSAINLVAGLCRQWVGEGKLVIKEANNEQA